MHKRKIIAASFIRNSRSIFRKLRKKKAAVRFILCIVILLSFNFMPLKRIVDDLRFSMTTVHTFLHTTFCGVHDYFEYFFDIGRLRSELQDLHDENLKLCDENKNLLKIKSENEELRRLLSMHDSDHHEVIVAKVITVLSNDYICSSILNVGAASGVAVDDVVKNYDGLIGRVVEVAENWSKVLFITDANSNIPVRIGSNSVNAIASGNNSNLLRITTVREDWEIQENDAAVTSGYGNIFCNGIPVGKIVKNGGDYMIIPAVDFNGLQYVSVLKNSTVTCINQDLI